MRGLSAPIVLTLVLALGASPLHAQSLRGSRASLYRQNDQAQRHDFSYLRTSSDVRRFVDLGLLVPLRGNADYDLAAVSFPYARPEVRTFVERLARQYRAACGEQLVVTSLTRPETRQPRNASDISVHPTGMALDLRRSNRSSCRAWLEDVLLALEDRGVLEATRERYPPHYHVALYPKPYMGYVQALASRSSTVLASSSADDAEAQSAEIAAQIISYRVRRGDSLWTIARRHDTTVNQIKAVNHLNSARIYPGQTLKVPTATR